MKLIASLVATATASNILQQANNAMRNNGAPEGLRTVTQADMDLINEYGCWCYFQNDYGSGRGKPVDEIDTLCKRLHDGYTCAIMDAEELGGSCVPWEIPYNSAIGSGMVADMDLATIRSECDAQNADTASCGNWVCKIEGYFVQQLVLFFTHGGLINHDNRHANGFNPKTDCPVSSGIKSEKACCDEYPLRFPFKTYNGARDCCFSHTFNTNLYQCCQDGKVKLSC